MSVPEPSRRGPVSIHSTPPRKGDGGNGRAIMPARPQIFETELGDGTPVFNAWVVFGRKRTYLRRYNTRPEAEAAALEFLRTGIKPDAGMNRNYRAQERRATLRCDRRGAMERWDVVGREGHGQTAATVHVGSSRVRAEAVAMAAEFEASGQVFTGDVRRTRGVAAKGRPTHPRRTKEATLAPVKSAPAEAAIVSVPRSLPPVNRWAERYGRAE